MIVDFDFSRGPHKPLRTKQESAEETVMTFKHEDRYIIIKLKNLTEDQLDSLETRMDN